MPWRAVGNQTVYHSLISFPFSSSSSNHPGPLNPPLHFSLPSSDRVVDDLNPVLTFTRREVESLLHFVEEEPDPSQVQLQPQDSIEGVLRKALHFYPHLITKVSEDWRLRKQHCSGCPLVVFQSRTWECFCRLYCSPA